MAMSGKAEHIPIGHLMRDIDTITANGIRVCITLIPLWIFWSFLR